MMGEAGSVNDVVDFHMPTTKEAARSIEFPVYKTGCTLVI